jgi:hypothetical protein
MPLSCYCAQADAQKLRGRSEASAAAAAVAVKAVASAKAAASAADATSTGTAAAPCHDQGRAPDGNGADGAEESGKGKEGQPSPLLLHLDYGVGPAAAPAAHACNETAIAGRSGNRSALAINSLHQSDCTERPPTVVAAPPRAGRAVAGGVLQTEDAAAAPTAAAVPEPSAGNMAIKRFSRASAGQPGAAVVYSTKTPHNPEPARHSMISGSTGPSVCVLLSPHINHGTALSCGTYACMHACMQQQLLAVVLPCPPPCSPLSL